MLDYSLQYSFLFDQSIILKGPKMSFIDASMAYSMIMCLPYIFHAYFTSYLAGDLLILKQNELHRIMLPFMINCSFLGKYTFLYIGVNDCQTHSQLTINTHIHTHTSWYVSL